MIPTALAQAQGRTYCSSVGIIFFPFVCPIPAGLRSRIPNPTPLILALIVFITSPFGLIYPPQNWFELRTCHTHRIRPVLEQN